MGHRVLSDRAAFRRTTMDLLEDHLSLVVPDAVLDAWLPGAMAEGRSPAEAAVLICHSQNQLVAESWVESDLMASELAEMQIADRIYESRKLLARHGGDPQEVMSDLAGFVRQPCFSDEFRQMIANTLSWHEMVESRVPSADDQSSLKPPSALPRPNSP